MPDKVNEKRIIYGFQGIRGMAIILIFLSHCKIAVNQRGGNFFGYAGAWGVSCFIMLSGFLAVQQFFDCEINRKRVISILKKKIKKCYPMHIITLCVALPLSVAFVWNNFSMKDVIKIIINATLTQTLIPSQSVYFSFNAVSWYLSLDIILVLFLPLVIHILKNMNERQVTISIVAVAVLQAILFLMVKETSIMHWFVYIFPLTRWLDYFVGGV